MKLRDMLLLRALACAGLLLGVFGALLLQLSFSLQLTRERDALEDQSAALAQSLEAAAVNYALQGITLTDELTRSLLLQLDPEAALYLPDGQPLTKNAPLPVPDTGIHLTGATLQSVRPVLLKGSVHHLLTRRSLSSLYETRRALLTGYLLLYLTALALFAAALMLIARSVSRPIERLAAVSRSLANGQLQSRASAAGSAETISLSRSFNQMADRLTGQIDRQQRFIADLTHEIKTPLTAIIGHADLIRSGRVQEEDAVLAAHQIFKEGSRLNALSARLIDWILLEQDELSPMPVHMRQLVRDTVSALLPAAEALNVSLSGDCADAVVEGDPALLRVLLNNLTDNALKSGAREVQITGRLAGERLTLSVSDDGRGIDDIALQRITEPFYRVDKSRSRQLGGAGLGLSLCEAIARLHGASLVFDSKPGLGTAVSLTLPGKERETLEDA